MSTVAITSGSKIVRQLSQALRRRIEEIGLDQGEAAERIGMSRTDLCRLLNGQGNPTVSTLERIADGLNIEITIN